MNDEEAARPKFVGECNDPYAMRTHDTCHLVRDGQGAPCIVTVEGDILRKYDVHEFVRHDIITKTTNKMQICRLNYYTLSAVHVSGDVFAHHQEHLTVFYSIW
jgi:hypothetical protein